MGKTVLNIYLVGTLMLASCALQRTTLTDKNMRVCIDSDSISKEHYVRVLTGLVDSGKWDVVDRGAGFQAAKKEQERQHLNETERFEAKEKWSHWKKLHGCGGIIAASAQCILKKSFFQKYYWNCQQFLTLLDASTAQVITAVEAEADGPNGSNNGPLSSAGLLPSWSEAVLKLNEKYPTHFESKEYHEKVKLYQEESQQLAEEQQRKMDEMQKREVAEDRQRVQENHQRKLELIKARNEGKFKDSTEEVED